MQLEVVIGLDLGVDWTLSADWEPEFDLVGKNGACFVSTDVGFDIDGAILSLGVDFHCDEFVVTEVVGEEGVGLPGEVGPGLDFDAFRLGHIYLN